MIKNYKGQTASFAQGGEVLGRTKYFAKTPDRSEQTRFMRVKDEFRDPDEGNPNADEDQLYGKKGEGAGKGFIKPPAAKDKSLKAVKPKG